MVTDSRMELNLDGVREEPSGVGNGCARRLRKERQLRRSSGRCFESFWNWETGSSEGLCRWLAMVTWAKK